MVDQVMEIVGRYQSNRWQKRGVTVDVEAIGNRPAGEIDVHHPMVRAAMRSLANCAYAGNIDLRISSTDANIPLSRGIPAVCIGVTEGGNAHRLQEWISTAEITQGIQHLLTLTWWTAAWLSGEVEPGN